MKKFLTLLTFVLFACANVSFAAMSTATPTSTTITAEVKKETKKEIIKDAFADLSQKQIIAAVLAFFVGAFGIHNFYLGRKKQAIWQLVLTLLVITSPISIIWSLVDFVRILMGKLG